MTTDQPEILQKLIDVQMEAEEVIAAEAAEAIVAEMEAHYPKELLAWLRGNAVSFVREEIGNMNRSIRSRAFAVAPRESFGSAAESGDRERIGLFASPCCVSADNTVKRLADVTGPEHLFVAESYDRTAEPALMRAAFHRALAKKVGNKRTKDVLSEGQCERLLASITKAVGRAA